MAARPNLIAIVGPTASGKTGLSIRVAEQFGCEIICADSRTVYEGMDIGTAKPTKQEQARVRHWGLDLVRPDQSFTVADFKRYAQEAIADIRGRGKVPLLVGGTGLYVDAVVYDYELGPPADPDAREKLESLTVEELQGYCVQNNIPLPENSQNKRHLVRAIERGSVSAISKSPLQQDSYIVGIATSMDTLRTRIVTRTEQLFENDVVTEATMLGKKYGWNSEAMTGNIYPIIKSHLEGELTLAEVKDRFTTLDYRLAKRQMTWFRRNPDIMWADLTGAEEYIKSLLAAE
jgi:tRNA dimethylallyltransferase